MQSGDQRFYLGRHHDEDARWPVANRREGMNGARGDHEVVPFGQSSGLAAVSHVELARQNAECFI